MMNICIVEGCEKHVLARGWCGKHYYRWKKHGSPLKTVKAANGQAITYFQDVVMNYDDDDCLMWPFYRDSHGYAGLGNPEGTSFVSRRVCEETFGPPPSDEHQAAHSCGNGHLGCVAKKHLRWATRLENEADKIVHGTISRGEARSKIDESAVLSIRLLKGALSQRKIAQRFGISQPTVSEIQTGKIWSWLNV